VNAPPQAEPRPGLTLETLERERAGAGFQALDLQSDQAAELIRGTNESSQEARSLATDHEAHTPVTGIPSVGRQRETSGGMPSVTGDEVADGPTLAGAGGGAPFATVREAPRAAAVSADREDDEAATGEDYAARLRLARARRREGRWQEALAEYRAVLKGSPELLDDVVSDLREAAAAANQPEAHRLLGDACIRQGDYLSALESYNRALAVSQGQGS
jgi:tetratricopeptide (TPR) repeat protein